MTIGTEVFVRIVKEGKEIIQRAAIKAIADTMEETVRFGSFTRPCIERCAEKRLEANLSGA